MDRSADTEGRGSALSDGDLLRTIGEDLRSLYAEIIKQPLPRKIEATLARIDQEQRRTDRQAHLLAQ